MAGSAHATLDADRRVRMTPQETRFAAEVGG